MRRLEWLLKRRRQSWQLKGRSPAWIRWWFTNDLRQRKLFPHSRQVLGASRLPVSPGSGDPLGWALGDRCWLELGGSTGGSCCPFSSSLIDPKPVGERERPQQPSPAGRGLTRSGDGERHNSWLRETVSQERGGPSRRSRLQGRSHLEKGWGRGGRRDGVMVGRGMGTWWEKR